MDYVTKPLHQEEVLSRITTHLKLKEMTNQLKEQTSIFASESSELEKAELFEEVQQQRRQLRLLNKRLNEVKEAEHKQLGTGVTRSARAKFDGRSNQFSGGQKRVERPSFTNRERAFKRS